MACYVVTLRPVARAEMSRSLAGVPSNGTEPASEAALRAVVKFRLFASRRGPVPKSDIQFNPDITVACVIVREGRFLLVEEEVRGRLVLNQPAGHLEPGEGLIEAAAREALEETGWQVRAQCFIGSYLWRAETGKTYIRFAFGAEALSLDPTRPLDAGITRCLWLTPGEIDAEAERLRSPLVKAVVCDFLAGQRAPLHHVRHLPS